MDPMSAAPLIAHLGRDDGDPDAMAVLAEAFRTGNPGHAVSFHRVAGLVSAERDRIVFVQRGEAALSVGSSSSPVGVGDMILVRGGEDVAGDVPLGLVAFTLPHALPEALPTFIRPDHDPKITDTPGGCAEEADAYRRILLTWLADIGPYTFDGLNAHRVRMWDSFSHYHPPENGFDELYLVEDVRPGGHVLFSHQRHAIERPEEVLLEDVPGLLGKLTPEPGDLVYIPRGTVHRGVGGVLAQVITVPGFKPGCEIGVDHHLRAINERFALEGRDALPFQEAASQAPLVK